MTRAGPSVSEELANGVPSRPEGPPASDPFASGPAGDAPLALGPAESERLRTLVHAHHAFVWRSLRRLGVLPGDVDDAAQKVFMTLARKLAEVPHAQERPFLFATSVRIASNARRAQSRVRHDGGAELDEVAGVSRSPESESADRELLDRILSPLPLDLRGPFILFELEQMTTQEIAELLEIPVGTAASRLRRARELVTETIQRFEARTRREDGGTR